MAEPTDGSNQEAADRLAQLRDLPERYRDVLSTKAEAVTGKSEPLPAEAVEEAAQARDVLDAAARRVERLLEDTKPVGESTGGPPPRRGHYQVDPDVVLDVLDANAERLARLVENVPDQAAGRPPGVREGLETIAGELVNEAVSESERRLRDAQREIHGDQ